jgi:hypothetical protein
MSSLRHISTRAHTPRLSLPSRGVEMAKIYMQTDGVNTDVREELFVFRCGRVKEVGM